MKKFAYILLMFCILTGCGKEQLSTDPSKLTVEVTRVAGTKVWFTITSSNPNAYYTYGMLTNEAYQEYESPKHVIDYQLEYMCEVYEELGGLMENAGSFSDVFLFQGDRSIKEVSLDPGVDYKIFVTQVDPQTKTRIGNVVMDSFTTNEIVMSDLTFDIAYEGDKLIITPSDLNATYYWDYDNSDVIIDKYGLPELCFYSLVDFYEDYDFMPNLVDRGVCEWIFSEQDKAIVEGEECTLVITGYEDGEINTEYFIHHFIYHKDNVIEID